MESLASLYEISFGVNDLNVAVGDVVKINESWGSYGAEAMVNMNPFLHAKQGATLQKVQSCLLYNARSRSAQTWQVLWLHSETE